MFKSSQFIMAVVSLFFSSFYNDLFWKKVTDIYTFNSENIFYFISLFLLLNAVIYIVLNIINFRYILKPVLIILFIMGALTNYFMNSYGIIIDNQIINKLIKIQTTQTKNLLSWKFALDIFIFGIIPSIVVYFMNIEYKTFGKHIVVKFLGIVSTLLIIVANLYMFSNFYTLLRKKHKPLIYYTNPVYPLYYSGKFVFDKYENKNTVVQKSAE